MALNNSAQPFRNGLVVLLSTRVRGVLQDRDFQHVLRQEGWRFLVNMTTEARAAWVRAGRLQVAVPRKVQKKAEGEPS